MRVFSFFSTFAHSLIIKSPFIIIFLLSHYHFHFHVSSTPFSFARPYMCVRARTRVCEIFVMLVVSTFLSKNSIICTFHIDVTRIFLITNHYQRTVNFKRLIVGIVFEFLEYLVFLEL